MKSKLKKKNPLTINEGNIRRWAYLNIPKYGENLANSHIFDFFKDHIIVIDYNHFYNKYLCLYTTIFSTDLSLMQKQKYWRYYMMDNPSSIDFFISNLFSIIYANAEDFDQIMAHPDLFLSMSNFTNLAIYKIKNLKNNLKTALIKKYYEI